ETLPHGLKNDEAENNCEHGDDHQAANAGAGGCDIVLKLAFGIDELCSLTNDAQMKKIRDQFHNACHDMTQWHGDEFGQGAEGHAKDKKEKGKETGPEKLWPPGETHQSINPREQRDDGNARLLDTIADDVQQKSKPDEEQSSAPGLHRLPQQFLSFPPKQA